MTDLLAGLFLSSSELFTFFYCLLNHFFASHIAEMMPDHFYFLG